MHLLGGLNAEGITICMVTHDIRYAQYSEAVISMTDGEFVGAPRMNAGTSSEIDSTVTGETKGTAPLAEPRQSVAEAV